MARKDAVQFCSHEWCGPFHGYGMLSNAAMLGQRASFFMQEEKFELAQQLLQLVQTEINDARVLVWPIDVYGQEKLATLERMQREMMFELSLHKIEEALR